MTNRIDTARKNASEALGAWTLARRAFAKWPSDDNRRAMHALYPERCRTAAIRDAAEQAELDAERAAA